MPMYHDLPLNAAFIRDCIEKLPAEAFDHICAEWPDLFTNQRNLSEYVNWVEGNDPDEIARDYGFEDFSDWTDDGEYWVHIFKDGVLVIE